MSLQDRIELQKQYDAAFAAGLEELAIAELLWEDRFWDLVKEAVARGTPLTRDEVEKAFPNASWEE